MLGSIYELRPLNCELFYIGSTDDMKQREDTHKSRVKTSSAKVYQQIRDCGCGFKMTLLYEYECSSSRELEEEEQRWIDKLAPQLNTNRAYNSEEYNVQYKRENAKKYYEQNREMICGKTKTYRQQNKERINEKSKIYRQQNRETLRELEKTHYEKNKDTIRKKQKIYCDQHRRAICKTSKIYREKNREMINEKQNIKYQQNKHKINERIICECGCQINKSSLNRHKQTTKHERLMEQNQSQL